MVGMTGRVIGRSGFKTPLVAGLIVLAAGIAWFSWISPRGSFVEDVLPASILAAIGMSLAYIPAMLSALSGAKPEEGGLASGIVNTTYQVGSAIGLAVMTAIATARGANQLSNPDALVDGFRAVFIGAALVALTAAAAAALWLRFPRQIAESEEANTAQRAIAD